ncbi:hypothetical protein F4809DRAFT_590164 [Biscogniauxia mediterranea]|nr:hypothetical protein F4809DRAFT_590164 [Biscogniauxia mediterranea]
MSQSEGKPNSTSETQVMSSAGISTQAELAQAFKDLARGEQQAAALEANLANLENRLDALLASIEGGSAPNGEETGRGKTADSTGEPKKPGKET